MDGHIITITYLSADGAAARLPAIAAEYLRQVRLVTGDDSQQAGAVFRLRDDLDPVLGQQRHDPFAQQRQEVVESLAMLGASPSAEAKPAPVGNLPVLIPGSPATPSSR